MPDDPDRDCPECAKVIINGGDAGVISIANAGLLKEVCTSIYQHLESSTLPNPSKLVRMANEIEDMTFDVQAKIFKFQREFLEQIGFTGPFPRSMS